MNKSFKLEINDVFHDLKDENIRLLRQLKFAQKLFEVIENYRNLLNICLNSCLNCRQNKEIQTKFNELQSGFGNQLKGAEQQLIIVFQKPSKQTNRSEIAYNCVDVGNEDQIVNSNPNEDHIKTDLNSIRFVSQLEPTNQKKLTLYQDRRPFKCQFCRNRFSEEYYLSLHVNIHHLNGGTDGKYYCCDWNGCHYKTKNMTIFKGHRMRHSGERPVKCLWPSCDRMFVTTCDMQRHMLRHQKTKPYRCDWPDCNSHFKTTFERNRHRVGHTYPMDSFPCPYSGCAQSFQTKSLLNIHKNKEHFSVIVESENQMNKNIDFNDSTSAINSPDIQKIIDKNDCPVDTNEGYFHCDRCPKSYKNRKHLLRHLRQSHTSCDKNALNQSSDSFVSEDHRNNTSLMTENSSKNSVKGKPKRPKRKYVNSYPKGRPFSCQFCRKSFSEEYILNLHINTIHSETDGKERYYCCDWNECKYKTKNMTIFKDHRKRHLGNKEVCCLWPSCDHMFVSTEDMKKHLVRHEEVRKYSCAWPGCQSSFKTQQGMRRHTDVHTLSPDQFPCDWPECQKRFRTMRQMRRHLLTVHNRYRKYSCHWPQCGKQFANSGQLQTHLTVHKGLKPHTCPVQGCDKRFADKSNMYKHFRLIHKKTQ